MNFIDRLETLSHRLAENASLRRRGAWLTARLLLQCDDQEYILSFRSGELTSITHDRGPMHDWDVALRMSSADWAGFWAPTPASGWHDIFALTRGGRLRIEGNHLPLMQNLQVIKDILALPRDASDVMGAAQ